MNKKFDFDDILITPSIYSNINSRSETNPFYDNGFLPLMTAPMDTVISNDNMGIFIKNNIIPILPRNLENNNQSSFISFGIDEFEESFIFNNFDFSKNTCNVLVDIANGHMKRLIDLSSKSKLKYGDKLKLMVGNIANPETYKLYSEVGVDYVRIGIGFGASCTSAANVGVGYSMASLISECYQIKQSHNYQTKIIADGGFKKYSDIIKGLALGADYIMLGSMFNKSLESSGQTVDENGNIINQFDETILNEYKSGKNFYKLFRGMSTKDVQKAWGKEKLKTSEGIVKQQKVEYTLSGWIENFTDYLKSAMSYTDSLTLNDFIGNVDYTFISQNSFNRYYK